MQPPIPRLPDGRRLPTSFTPTDAAELITALANAYGLTCTIYGPTTIEDHLAPTRAGHRRELTGDEWARIRRTTAWQALLRTANSAAGRAAAQHAAAAIRQAGLECANCRTPLTAPPDETYGYCARCLGTIGLVKLQQRPCALTGTNAPHDFTDSPTCHACGMPAPQPRALPATERSNVTPLRRPNPAA
ncbi:hypothetical protein [Dactylosporangium sp. CA-139066]|uniref:hypothetical protein n=1 Tax=Dactylosporangium sp. CA-139066 TaxID=3239930 RepID=UPI003D8C8FCF